VQESRLVLTVEQRDALRERLLRLAEDDERVVAGAAVGSLAVDGGDRFSDLDLLSVGEARLAHAGAVAEHLADFVADGGYSLH
jgi:hypothetical protein